MRIALFTETYLPCINGVVTHVKLLKEGLERLGHQVLVVAADCDAATHYIRDDVLHCPARSMGRFYGFGAASPVSAQRMRFVRAFDPDLIHIHNEFGVGLSGIMAARLLHRPLVYTLHTMYDEYIYYVVPQRLAGAATRASRQYIRLLAGQASALTGPSRKCAEYFKDAGVRKNVHVIHNAVELDAFRPEQVRAEDRDAFRKRYNIPSDRLLACFVGRLGREKSVDVTLEYWAAELRPEDPMHLVVIGDGPCRGELEEQAVRLGIRDRVTFTGAIQHEELPPCLAACDVYLTSSLSDTNSISMLEGMAAGLPVLQRLDPLNAEQVREGENGFLFNSAAELAEALRAIRDMPAEQLLELRGRVTASVLQSGAENLAQEMLSVYGDLLEQPRQAGKKAVSLAFPILRQARKNA